MLKIKIAIGMKWCNIKKFFTSKTFSKLDMLIFLGWVLFWAYMNTDLFRAWADFFQLVYFSGGLAIGWTTGYISIRKVKNTLERAKRIIDNPRSVMDKKYSAAVDAVEESCFFLGVVFEKYNRKQGTGPKWEDVKKEVKKQSEGVKKE